MAHTPENDAPCQHLRVSLIYAPPGGRWACDTCGAPFQPLDGSRLYVSVIPPGKCSETCAPHLYQFCSPECEAAASDDDLPGMWSFSDFTGGDPDERSYAERGWV